jgi:hypothetical protein
VGAAAVQIGPDALATAAVLNKQFAFSFGKIATFFAERFGLHVVPSTIGRALHRAATKALPTYTALVQTVRNSPRVGADETGWRVKAQLWWLHGFVTPETTVYAILRGRGFDEAACVLGPAFAGVLGRDGWAPYRQFDAAHQTCLTHLLELARQLHTDHPCALLPGQVQDVLHEALAMRDRRAAGTISEHGAAVARGRLITRLSRVLDQSTSVAAIRRFMRHLHREWTALFSFLFDLTLKSRPRTGEPSTRCAGQSSPAKCAAAAIERRAAPSPSTCLPASFERPVNTALIDARSSSRCSGPPFRPSHPIFNRDPDHTERRNQLPFPLPLRANLASGSVVEACVSFVRRSP